jgi:hypothetical protein
MVSGLTPSNVQTILNFVQARRSKTTFAKYLLISNLNSKAARTGLEAQYFPSHLFWAENYFGSLPKPGPKSLLLSDSKVKIREGFIFQRIIASKVKRIIAISNKTGFMLRCLTTFENATYTLQTLKS